MLRTPGRVDNVVSGSPENLVDIVASRNIVVAFEPVQLVFAFASEEVVEPGGAEDLLVVSVADPLDAADVRPAIGLGAGARVQARFCSCETFFDSDDFDFLAVIFVCMNVGVLHDLEGDRGESAGLTSSLGGPLGVGETRVVVI